MMASRACALTLLVVATACSREASLQPAIPLHVRLMDGTAVRALEGWIMVPPGFEEPLNGLDASYLATRSQTFIAPDSAPPHVTISLSTSDEDGFFTYNGATPAAVARSPCRMLDVDRVHELRRVEAADSVQVTCEHTWPTETRREVIRVMRWEHVYLACAVRGTMSDQQLREAWNVCATLQIAEIEVTHAWDCRHLFQGGISRFELEGCEEYLPRPEND